MTAPASVYPVAVADLVDDFQAWAKELGDTPSHRATMKRFRIGTDKARALLSTLPTYTTDEPTTTAAPDAAPDALPAPVAPVLPEVPAEPITAPAELLYRVDVAAPSKITPPAAEPVAPARTAAPAAAPIPVPVPAPIAPAVRVRPKPRVRTWPILVVGLGAFIAIWAGWVELGRLTGFGVVHPLPGIWDSLKIDTAITLPLGMDAYAAFALKVWFTPGISPRARKFARWSTIVSLLVGMCGQVAYHLMAAQGITSAPWQITTAVSCLPVIVLGLASGLVHLVRADQEED